MKGKIVVLMAGGKIDELVAITKPILIEESGLEGH